MPSHVILIKWIAKIDACMNDFHQKPFVNESLGFYLVKFEVLHYVYPNKT